MSITAIPVDIYLKSVLGRLEQHYQVMADALGPPEVVTQGCESWFRYPKQSDSLLCLLKGVKLVSTLNAALVLLHHGYFHEVAALCRMADDFILEILFMRQTLNGDKRSQAQEQFFTDFFQEEFEDIEDPLGTSKARHTVPRKKSLQPSVRSFQEGSTPPTRKMLLRLLTGPCQDTSMVRTHTSWSYTMGSASTCLECRGRPEKRSGDNCLSEAFIKALWPLNASLVRSG